MDQLTPKTPYQLFKDTYTPLYRTLLVLGALSALMATAGINGIHATLSYLSTDLPYALSNLVSLFIVLPLMIASLILLWHKHPVGIHLRLAGYGAAIVAAVLTIFTSASTRETLTKDLQEVAVSQGGPAMTPELAASITETSFSSAPYISIFISLLFAYLWWSAWKKQLLADNKAK